MWDITCRGVGLGQRDRQPMAPLEGVIQLQGDITSSSTAEQVG